MVKYYDLPESDVSIKPYEEGALYYCNDSKNIYYDSPTQNKRIKMSSDIIILNTESDRNSILAPLSEKIYAVLSSGCMYIYSDKWILLGGAGFQIPNVVISDGNIVINDSRITSISKAEFVPDSSISDLIDTCEVVCSEGSLTITITPSTYNIFGTVLINGGINGDNILTDEDIQEIANSMMTSEIEFAIEKVVENRNSVCIIEETGADIGSEDNSEHFDADCIVVQNDTYLVDKATMLSLPNKKLVGNGSVGWKDWDNIIQGWKDTFDANMLSHALKVKYADDPIYLSMKLPSEANFSKDYITRPGMQESNASGTYTLVDNIGVVMPVDYTQLPDEVVICIGNMSLYTLSRGENAKWKLHDKCVVPSGYSMYYIPWNNGDANIPIDSSKITVFDDYIKFCLKREDFAPDTVNYPNSLAKTLHFWGDHKNLDLADNLAVITFYEVWTETAEAVGHLYSASGCDQKSDDRQEIAQNFWGRNVLLGEKKTVITGHNISDSLYKELRDTPNDTRLVYEDYASGHGSDYDLALLKSQVDEDLADKGVKINACFSTLEVAQVTTLGININPGIYETGYINSDGTDYDGYHDMSFRTKGYIKVESGRTIALYYDKAEWNKNDNGKGFYIYEYDINKTFIRGSNVTEGTLFLPSYLNNGTYILSENAAYIRINYNNWSAFTTSISDIKAAIYYIENARKEFVDYHADIEAVYAVKGDSVILTSPNGLKFSLAVLDDGTLTTSPIEE